MVVFETDLLIYHNHIFMLMFLSILMISRKCIFKEAKSAQLMVKNMLEGVFITNWKAIPFLTLICLIFRLFCLGVRETWWPV